ncbi:hypothetical protein HXX01_03135 [Candidatus Nomurabacteria bacterium]|nr:hypothetical protein [Candidatus Nomurabacteria bacterium]
MESFKNVISLNQAAKISGYTQDYLGYLIRTGEMKGVKKGRAWFTTEEDVKNYIFKKKVRSEKLAVKEFFSPTRTKNIIIATAIVFLVGFFLLSTVDKGKEGGVSEVRSGVASDGEAMKISD